MKQSQSLSTLLLALLLQQASQSTTPSISPTGISASIPIASIVSASTSVPGQNTRLGSLMNTPPWQNTSVQAGPSAPGNSNSVTGHNGQPASVGSNSVSFQNGSLASVGLNPAPSTVSSDGLLPSPSIYTLDDITLTGDPSIGMVAASTTITPGGPPLVVSSHTVSILVTVASNQTGAIMIDGTTTILSDPKSTLSPTSNLNSITSTDTVPPSDASTEASTNTAFTENMWLTTETGGHTTIVPVIVGCPNCGGKLGGLILWNFPSLPKVKFSFPKLKIPSISFPCIPIFLIHNCPSPPDSSSGGSESGDPPSSESPSTTSPSGSSSTSSTLSSSSSSSSSNSSSLASTSSASNSSSLSSTSSAPGCPLTSYSFSLTPGTDLTTLTTGSATNTSQPSSSSSVISCRMTPYTFSLTPGTDLVTLITGSSTTSGSVLSASLASVSSVSSNSTVSAASAATAFDPAQTTLSCGQKYPPDSHPTYTSVPRAQTADILRTAEFFCTPSINNVSTTYVFNKDKPAHQTEPIGGSGQNFYRLRMGWDPRPECASVKPPDLRDAEPVGPDYWCNVYFDALINTCDAGPGLDKSGGVMYAQCVIWSWEAFVRCVGCEPII